MRTVSFAIRRCSRGIPASGDKGLCSPPGAGGGKRGGWRSQQPLFALRAQLGGSHPLISAALGQRAAQGLIKRPAAIRGTRCLPRQQGPATTTLLGVRRRREDRAAPRRSQPFPAASWLPREPGAVTRARRRHPCLCGGFLSGLKGKSTQEGATLNSPGLPGTSHTATPTPWHMQGERCSRPPAPTPGSQLLRGSPEPNALR